MTTTQTAPAPVATESVHVADRLIMAMRRCRSPVCVGIDPVVEKLPAALKPGAGRDEISAAFLKFSTRIIEVVAELVPCVKFQSACFERYGSPGLAALEQGIQKAKAAGLEVIRDVKRCDIGVTADHYAAAVFPPDQPHADWATVNSFLGADSMVPFLKRSGGAFALVRTSNAGGDALQSLKLKDGQSFAQAVARMVADTGRLFLGASGFSSLGAVVGATKPQDMEALRAIMPQQMFLVPGFGAQGGTIKDVMACFKQGGNGAIISSSRGIIYGFTEKDKDWSDGVRRTAKDFAEEVGKAVHWR